MSRFVVIFGFCTLIAGTQTITTSRGEHRGSNLIIMSLKHPSPLPASRFSITHLNSGSKWAQNAKKPNNPLLIHYISKIRCKNFSTFFKISPPRVMVNLPPSGLRVHASFMFYMLYNSLNPRF